MPRNRNVLPEDEMSEMERLRTENELLRALIKRKELESNIIYSERY